MSHSPDRSFATTFLRRAAMAAAVAIVLAAWAMRVLALDTLPPGIDRDTATNGVYALYVLHDGIRPLFYRVGAPEPLIIYAQALAVALLGVSVFALRIVTAIIGTLTVAALFMVARAFKSDWRVAVLAAFGLAISVEHAHLSRLGLRAIFIPLAELLLLYFFWRGLRGGRLRDFVVAGAVLGASYYTYLSAIFLALLPAAFVLHQLLFNRAAVLARRRGMLVTAMVGLVVAAPLVAFEIIYPEAAFFRASQVTLLQNPAVQQVGVLGALALKLVSQAKMFGIEWQGQYNPLSQPLLDPFWFACFLIGLAICLRRFKRIEYAWALLTIGIMLLPDVIGGNEVFPQELRVIGVIPPTFFVGAVGLIGALDFSKRWQPRAAYALAAIVLFWSSGNAADAYFNRWGKTDDPNFNLAEVAEGKWLAQTAAPVLVPLNEYARQPVRYLAGARAPRVRSALDANGNLIPGLLGDRALAAFPVDPTRPRFEGRTYADDPAAFVLVRGDKVYLMPPMENEDTQFRASDPADEIRYSFGSAARVYAVSRAPRVTDAPSSNAVHFGADITLVSSTLDARRVEPGESIPVSLYWRTARRLAENDTIFVHLLDVNQRVAATADVIPALGVYPTFLWKPDEIVPTHHQIKVPLRTPPGKYSIEVGLYNTLDLIRLNVVDASGSAVDSRVVIDAVKVAPRQAIAYNPSHAQSANFDHRIALTGFDLARGETAREFKIALYWRAAAEMERDYTVFVHVLDANGGIVA
ncbi:MAG: glycosyltransferase family 39 protein, partial [Chloroflexota bacterium]|nr:glycosyltransferase family 39 protein [Chloroflexota bacterium]